MIRHWLFYLMLGGILFLSDCRSKNHGDEKEDLITSLEKQHEMDSMNLEYDRESIRDSMMQSAKPLSYLYHKLKQSVFMVMTRSGGSVGQGTAFLVDHHGTCITNQHVLAQSNSVELIDEKHNKHHILRMIHVNADMDYAIFQIDHAEELEPLILSNHNAEIGEECFAIGNPQGLESTLSTGIISGYRKGDAYIQTTTEIAHGSSGGPLFNRRGEVIGITSMAVGDAHSLNFAINIHELKDYLPTIDRNITLLSSKGLNGNTTIPSTIRDFILADEDRDLDGILKCFSPEVYRCWDIVTPNQISLTQYYNTLWKKARENKMVVRNVNRVGVGIFQLTMDYSRWNALNNQVIRVNDALVEFELDEDGLIRSVHDMKTE